MKTYSVETEIGGRTLRFETGKLAKQAAGAVLVTYGETIVLCTVVTADPREGIDFFPLTVDYREKMYAAGKFPGGFFKREARPTNKEILTMRLTDRPLRPLFPEGFRNEVQIQCMVLASDQEHDADTLAMCGASAALAVSPVPFDGPTAGVRVCRVDGQFIVNPTIAQRGESDLEVIVAGHEKAVNMIEGSALEVPEKDMCAAIAFAFEEVKKIVAAIRNLAEQVGAEKVWTPPAGQAELADKVKSLCDQHGLKATRKIPRKQDRYTAVKDVFKKILAELCPKDAETPLYAPADVTAQIQKIEEHLFHQAILNEGLRTDGRGPEDIRPIICEVGSLQRTHGSSIFTRGETQALVVTTLGTVRDEQIVDDLLEEYSKKFMLHYNFPPFCTGEVKRLGAVSRREIGHGSLAERALQAVMPSPDQFPYTIRLVSDILESNGSSSMASVCGGTLALMDAGVPIKHPVAGISIGRVHDDDSGKYMLLTDILGEEDHFGDMDFKVAGTQVGVTAVQLDLKIASLSQDQIVEAFTRARSARIKILKEMLQTLPEPRREISKYAPRILSLRVNPERIGKIIGPAGKGIKALEANSGAKIEIGDDGMVTISCINLDGAQAAYDAIEQISEGVKLGRVYTGRVTSIKDFGAFIEVAPGLDGLCHISELSDGYVQRVSDVCKIGDVMRVKVILIDDTGRVKLSRKAVLIEEGGSDQPVGAPVGGGEDDETRGPDRDQDSDRGPNRDRGPDRGRDQDRGRDRGRGR